MISGERLNLKGEVIVSFFNELDIGKELCSRFQVRSRMGLSMCVLASPKIENSKVFHDYRV